MQDRIQKDMLASSIHHLVDWQSFTFSISLHINLRYHRRKRTLQTQKAQDFRHRTNKFDTKKQRKAGKTSTLLVLNQFASLYTRAQKREKSQFRNKTRFQCAQPERPRFLEDEVLSDSTRLQVCESKPQASRRMCLHYSHSPGALT